MSVNVLDFVTVDPDGPQVWHLRVFDRVPSGAIECLQSDNADFGERGVTMRRLRQSEKVYTRLFVLWNWVPEVALSVSLTGSI